MYNHKEDNVFKACGLSKKQMRNHDRQRVKALKKARDENQAYFSTMSFQVEMAEKCFTKRELAYLVVAAHDSSPPVVVVMPPKAKETTPGDMFR